MHADGMPVTGAGIHAVHGKLSCTNYDYYIQLLHRYLVSRCLMVDSDRLIAST